MENKGHRIASVAPGSIAEELEIEVGDRLLSIDGHELKDVLDYRFYINAEEVTLLVEKPDGELWELDIENDYEDLGIEFDSGLMSIRLAPTNVYFVLLIKCHQECERHSILRMMIPDFLFCREIM